MRLSDALSLLAQLRPPTQASIARVVSLYSCAHFLAPMLTLHVGTLGARDDCVGWVSGLC